MVYRSNVGKGVSPGLELIAVTGFPKSLPVDHRIAVNPQPRKPESPNTLSRSIKPTEDAITFETEPPLPVRNKTNRTSSPEMIQFDKGQTATTSWGFDDYIARSRDYSVSIVGTHFVRFAMY